MTGKNATGPQADMQAQVARDLSGIFAQVPHMTAMHPETCTDLAHKRVGLNIVACTRTERAARRPGFRLLWLAIICVILLVGAAAGWLLVKDWPAKVPGFEGIVATPVKAGRGEATESGSRIDAPMHAAPSPIPVPISAAASYSARVRSAPFGREATLRRRQPARASRPAEENTPGAQGKDAALRTASVADAECMRLAPPERAWCLRPALLAADHRLRIAYERARSVGASGRLLARYQKRWLSVRRDAEDAPDYVIDQYNQLAQRLESLSSQPASLAEH